LFLTFAILFQLLIINKIFEIVHNSGVPISLNNMNLVQFSRDHFVSFKK